MIQLKLPMRFRQNPAKLFALRIFSRNLKTYQTQRHTTREWVYFVWLTFHSMLFCWWCRFSSNDLSVFVQTCNKTIKTLFRIFFSSSLFTLPCFVNTLVCDVDSETILSFSPFPPLSFSHSRLLKHSSFLSAKRPLSFALFCKINRVFELMMTQTSTPFLQIWIKAISKWHFWNNILFSLSSIPYWDEWCVCC